MNAIVPPVMTTNIAYQTAVSDEIIVNREGSTAVQTTADLATQLAGTSPLDLAGFQAPLFATEVLLKAAPLASKVSAWVFGDPDPEKNGIWSWTGTVWAWTLPLPYSMSVLHNPGAGTPNAIITSSSVPLVKGMLVILPITATTTASPVTVKVNNKTFTLKSLTGGDILPGSLLKDMMLLALVEGNVLRLISDQASAAVVAQAQAAAQVALAAANSRLVFNSVAAFKAANIDGLIQSVEVLGFYAPGDGGRHTKFRMVAAPSVQEPWHEQSNDGAWWEIKEREVTPQMFGAKADATDIGVGTDDTASIEKWKKYLSANLRTTGVLKGVYRYNPATAWDVGARNDGYSVVGRSKNGDGFYLDNGKTLALEAVNGFYHRFEHVHIRGRVAGPVLRIGKNDFSDAFNSCSFILVVNNDSLDDAAEGTRFNYVLQSDVNLVSNCGGTGRPGEPTAPGHGKAIVIRQACFNTFHLAGGQANIALYLTTGAIFSNTFVSFDAEEVSIGIKCDSPSASRNAFDAGQVLGQTTFDFTAGNTNIIRSGVNPAFYSGGSIGANLVGVEIERLAFTAQLADPAIPASGVYWKNTSGSKVQVMVFAGNVQLIQVKSPDGGVKDFNPQVVGESITVTLPPNWSIAVTYSNQPAWRMFPI